jgi:putative transposase
VKLLAYVTGSVNQELLLRNEYLAAENRILRAKLPVRPRLANSERASLAEIGRRLGRRALSEKFDGSKNRAYPGRPMVQPEEALVTRMARENSGWGYDRIVGALTNLG